MLKIIAQKVLLVILRRLNPEWAHCIAVFFLKGLQSPLRMGFGKRVSSPTFAISRELAFPSRLGLAAGFDKNAEVFAGLGQVGFGFVEVGTVTLKPQPGNPKPRLWRTAEYSLVNQMGFNNCGMEKFLRNLKRYKHKVQIPVFVNIGKGKDSTEPLRDYEELLKALSPLADAFVVNISSPNTPGLRDLQSTQFLESLEGLIPDNKRVLVKLAPDLENAELSRLCRFVGNSKKLSGVVVTNTSIRLARERGFEKGGLSGRPLFQRSLECVTLARKDLPKEKLLIGVGGIFQGIDAQRMIAAGADLVEIYTAFIYRGLDVVDEINQALR